MAEKVTEFQVVAARGIRFRNSPKFDDVTPGPGPVLGNVLPGYLITVDDRQFLKVQDKELYLPYMCQRGECELVTDTKAEVYEVLAFQGVRYRTRPVFDQKADGPGPTMGARVAGKVVVGKDGMEYLHVFDTGLYCPLTTMDKTVMVLSPVLEEEDISKMVDSVWDGIGDDFPATPPMGNTPTHSPPKKDNSTAPAPAPVVAAVAAEEPVQQSEPDNSAGLQALEQQRQELTAQCSSTSTQLEEVQSTLASTLAAVADVEAKLKDSQNKCKLAEETSDKACEVTLDLQDELDEATEEAEELEEEVEALRAKNAELMAEVSGQAM